MGEREVGKRGRSLMRELLSPKHASILAIVTLITVGAVLSLLGNIRIGASLIGTAPLVAAGFRLRYRASQVPYVVSRSAGFDIAVGLMLGVAVWTVAWLVPQ